eukprot:TRINITY_DN14797_c0_g1_i1.p1 TRINITY_DN14797_c0_g1~~TRINITY_DN14797_c0_g1_i1.p1  ORF type:complete len:389 (-),score=64.21 TRINITY_DN14797_c0_g1_i1:64-1230(-)
MMEFTKLEQQTTPAFVVYLSKVQENSQRMIQIAKSRGVSLRPHVKTHKTIEAATLQTMGQEKPKIVVSTLSEARFFAAGGFGDILYAVPITSFKLAEAAIINSKISALHLLVDNSATIDEVLQHAKQQNVKWSVFLKIDTGYHRCGVDPVVNEEECVALVRKLNVAESEGLITFTGLYSHSGHSYHGKNTNEVAETAKQEVDVMTNFVKLLEAKQLKPPSVVTIGATPSCSHLPQDMGRVTEIHPGNYSFYDTCQSDLGSCTPNDVACEILTRVIGHYPRNNTLVIDAGALAVSKDRGASHLSDNLPDRGYGLIKDHPELILTSVSQEVGIIKNRDVNTTFDYEKFPIGSFLRIIPNHSCLSAACYSEYKVLNDKDQIISIWKTCREW